MSLKETRSRIEEKVKEYFSSLGFTYKSSWKEHCKQSDELLYSFYPLITTWPKFLSIDNHAYIRFVSFEKSFKKLCPGYPDITLGNSIGRIANSPDGRIVNPAEGYDIFVVEGAEGEAIEVIKAQFEEVAHPFYEKFKNPNAIVDYFLQEPYGIVAFQDVHLIFLKGVLMAKMYRKHDYPLIERKFDELVRGKLNSTYEEDYFALKERIGRYLK